MSYQDLPTTVLLDLAEDYNSIASKFIVRSDKSGGGYLLALDKLASIDTELLSRMPEYEPMTVYDFFHTEGDLAYFIEFLSVGFEPYIGEDNEYLTYLAIERQLYEQANLDASKYYFYRD